MRLFFKYMRWEHVNKRIPPGCVDVWDVQNPDLNPDRYLGLVRIRFVSTQSVSVRVQ